LARLVLFAHPKMQIARRVPPAGQILFAHPTWIADLASRANALHPDPRRAGVLHSGPSRRLSCDRHLR
jgi:hypothetical protein